MILIPRGLATLSKSTPPGIIPLLSLSYILIWPFSYNSAFISSWRDIARRSWPSETSINSYHLIPCIPEPVDAIPCWVCGRICSRMLENHLGGRIGISDVVEYTFLRIDIRSCWVSYFVSLILRKLVKEKEADLPVSSLHRNIFLYPLCAATLITRSL
jgi:hypothetical protein